VKITVAMPVFNRERHVEVAIRSLLRHRPAVDIDILVVDDGSTDGSARVVQELQQHHDCIRLVRHENRGVSAARNTALQNLHPEAAFVSFLDSDDVSAAGRYVNDLGHFANDPSLGLVYSRLTIVQDIDPATHLPPPDGHLATVRGINLAAGTFRRNVIETVGVFDESLSIGEDLDFLLRVFELGIRFRLSDEVAMFYRRHAGNMTSDDLKVRRGVMHALMKSAKRRAANPALLREIPSFLDIAEMAKIGGKMPKGSAE
jgi:glycosyltransferase involved in cell wall biosynthesis